MAQFITQASLMEERRKANEKYQIPYRLAGSTEYVEKELINGEMNAIEISKPYGEMIASASVEAAREFVQKSVLDVEFGRESVPTLYEPIYDRKVDPNFPETFDVGYALSGRCVFLEHFEGGEVKFGSLAAEKGPIARIKAYTTGFEFTKELFLYNYGFKIDEINKSVGEAYNALLNHIHLYPIIGTKYKAANQTAKVAVAEGQPAWTGVYNSLRAGIKAAAAAKRPGTILLASSADELDIKEALAGNQLINGNTYQKLDGISTVIFYDGWETKVGQKDYKYEGVKPGTVYLIRPKAGFKEFVKVDLTTEFGNKDLSRLVEDQMVAYAFRGVFAAVDENVQEIKIY